MNLSSVTYTWMLGLVQQPAAVALGLCLLLLLTYQLRETHFHDYVSSYEKYI